VRIVRIQVCHEGAFWSLVESAWGAAQCRRHRGRWWRKVNSRGGVSVYHLCDQRTEWFQEQVEQYEFFLYSRLLEGHFGRDGRLRSPCRLRRGGDGSYRAVSRATRRVG
jgi:hypothetical protein